MVRTDTYCCYDVSLKPCPRCGGVEQSVVGINTRGEWDWWVECNTCPDSIRAVKSEDEAIKAWNRRYKENETKQEVKQQEVEQDGDITWDFYDLVVKCLERYADECRSRVDRAD